ncbi:hypothetical protein [Pontiella sulfatireligans]|uniref:Uncharacterized protein n=1 Tax=Pontiella sulfatireligans TaxID=2750658 RepID=A0A6C2UPH7_9BACT|nr:hypothetical protein [Pontiella sulfatireligans]VGO22192.1 hypothetical protein SCARR_04274 [Pontiella sulfatireligans]
MTVSKVTLNGKIGGSSIAAAWIRALNDPGIVREKAGFLFKASLDGDHLMLAAVPCLINGARSHHYDQHLEKEDAFTLLGAVNAGGVFTIMVKPDSNEQITAHAAEFIDVYRQFAALLLNQGYAGEGLLDEVTQGVLQAFGLNPLPSTLSELAMQ